MKKLFSLFAIITCFSLSMSAQVYAKLYTGRAQDTIHKSTTLTSSSVNLINSDGVKAIVMQVAADSVSGSPAPLFILQRSIDGVHFESFVGDSLTCTVTGGVGTVAKTVVINPFSYAYARVLIKTTSATQKEKIHVSLFAIKAGVK